MTGFKSNRTFADRIKIVEALIYKTISNVVLDNPQIKVIQHFAPYSLLLFHNPTISNFDINPELPDLRTIFLSPLIR